MKSHAESGAGVSDTGDGSDADANDDSAGDDDTLVQKHQGHANGTETLLASAREARKELEAEIVQAQGDIKNDDDNIYADVATVMDQKGELSVDEVEGLLGDGMSLIQHNTGEVKHIGKLIGVDMESIMQDMSSIGKYDQTMTPSADPPEILTATSLAAADDQAYQCICCDDDSADHAAGDGDEAWSR